MAIEDYPRDNNRSYKNSNTNGSKMKELGYNDSKR